MLENSIEAKEDLVDAVSAVVGREPSDIRLLLKALSHPDVVEQTRRYFNMMDTTTRCLKYEEPWSCAKEAEARYENIKYGWLGAGNGVGYSEWWCENCRRRVMEGV